MASAIVFGKGFLYLGRVSKMAVRRKKTIPQRLKPHTFWASCGTAEAMPFQSAFLKHSVERILAHDSRSHLSRSSSFFERVQVCGDCFAAAAGDSVDAG